MAKAPKKAKPEQETIEQIHEGLLRLRQLSTGLSKPATKKVMAELDKLMAEIMDARGSLDSIKEPGASFDPTNPDTAGRLVALALIAQDKVPLARIARTYGSGIYAIYYSGDHPAYSAVSNKETPVYVGKADPKSPDAKTAREQGPQLFGRLADHRRMIETVGKYATENRMPHPLNIDDFQCRRLVCATNAQLVAERHLISMFRPVWNSEIGICWGISKHGDAADTRANKRSPWDVMHPGRKWAMAESLEDSMSQLEIAGKILQHFSENPPYRSVPRIVHYLLNDFVQNAAMTREEAEAADQDDEVIEAVIRELPFDE